MPKRRDVTTQVSLDLTTIGQALEMADGAVRAGIDWLEAGTPLILGEGLHAVRALRDRFPEHPIVADLKTMDGAGLEAEMMLKAGATHVVVMSQAHWASVKEMIKMARDLNGEVMADVLNAPDKADAARRHSHFGPAEAIDKRKDCSVRLKERIALVTGSSSGVGAAIAKGFAAEGADVVVNYNRNEAGARKTADRITGLGRKTLVVQADVGRADDVQRLLGETHSRFGRLDILVNNAGYTLKKPFEESDEDDWNRVLDTNLKSVFLCSRQALPLMPAHGAILNISSSHALVTTFNFSIYAASKGGMEALTRSMAIEFGGRAIRVNTLRLGAIQVERDRLDPDDPAHALICERIPLGRLGEVEDVAPVAVLLCSDDASFITGQVIAVDGGHEIMLNTAFPKGHVDGGARDA